MKGSPLSSRLVPCEKLCNLTMIPIVYWVSTINGYPSLYVCTINSLTWCMARWHIIAPRGPRRSERHPHTIFIIDNISHITTVFSKPMVNNTPSVCYYYRMKVDLMGDEIIVKLPLNSFDFWCPDWRQIDLPHQQMLGRPCQYIGGGDGAAYMAIRWCFWPLKPRYCDFASCRSLLKKIAS